MKFEQYRLNDKIIKALNKLGFKKPTDIQFKSIPSIMKGENLLAIAQTGTGKTAAFAIPVIDRIYRKKIDQRRYSGLSCLVLAPTHELALQLESVFQSIAKYTTVKIASLIGGVDQDPQIAHLVKGVDIAIATPGRMFDLISQGYLKTQQIDMLILDEADHMLDLGFIKDIKDLLRKLPKRRQTLFFSATINEEIKKIAYSIVGQNAIRIQLSPKDPVAKNIDHAMMFIEMDDKRFFLERVIRENPETKILVFVRTRVRADRVQKAMGRVGIEAVAIHGDMDQPARRKVMDLFRSSEVNLLIATDVSARGIDIPDIHMVINYDLPDVAENYVHRVGRTGRGKNRGLAYSFCSKGEKELLENIESFLGKEIPVVDISKQDYQDTLKIERERKLDYMSIIDEMVEMEEKYKKKKKRK